jgi:hypothetical protein
MAAERRAIIKMYANHKGIAAAMNVGITYPEYSALEHSLTSFWKK